MLRLGHHDMADIRLRLALKATTRQDVEALLGEVDALAADIAAVGGQLDPTLTRAPPWEIAEALRDHFEEFARLAGAVRECERFERACSAIVSAMRESADVRDLLESEEQLALACEFCSMCGSGHADDKGVCQRHGKKVRYFWNETTGPTQTGLIHLVAFVLPLLAVLRDVADEAERARLQKSTRNRGRLR